MAYWNEITDRMFEAPIENGICKINVQYLGSSTNKTMYIPTFPDSVSFRVGTNYSGNSIIGRTGSIYGYTSTNDQSVSFTLQLHRELKITNGTWSDGNKVDELVSLIESACYPLYNPSANSVYPPLVTYKFGDTCIVGVQTSCDTTWGGNQSSKINGAYMSATLNISVTCLAPKVIDGSNVQASNPRGWGLFDSGLNSKGFQYNDADAINSIIKLN